jgi:hypothetical protein
MEGSFGSHGNLMSLAVSFLGNEKKSVGPAKAVSVCRSPKNSLPDRSRGRSHAHFLWKESDVRIRGSLSPQL